MSFSFTYWLHDDTGEKFPTRVDVDCDEYNELDEWRVTVNIDGVDIDISNRLTDNENAEIDGEVCRSITTAFADAVGDRAYDEKVDDELQRF